MEALNAVGLNPLSVLAKRTETKKKLSLSSIFPLKNQSFPELSAPKTLQGSLVLLSSALNAELAKALTYEEALQQSTTSSSSDIDVSGALDGIVSFVTENPLILGGGAIVLAVPLLVSQLLSKPNKPFGVESAKGAYVKLGDDANAQLLDIRAASDIKQVGSPDVRGLKKKAVAVVYKGEDKPGFLSKLSLKFKEPENTTLYILDKFDGNSELVAELVTSNGFKAAYAIKDGAEGPRGWTNSGLPWIVPKKSFSLDLSNLTGAVGEASEIVPLALGFAAAAGLGLLAFTEVETVLQVLGSAAIVQFVSKKVLFAEDRKQTIQQLEDVLNAKIAPNELVGDIQQIGRALLPLPTTGKALPPPAESTPPPAESTAPPAESAVQKIESTPEAKVEAVKEPEPIPEPIVEAVQKIESTPEPKAEAVPEPAPEVNSVPKAEVEEKSPPVIKRSSSPFPNYPDFKPPTSPMPSRP